MCLEQNRGDVQLFDEPVTCDGVNHIFHTCIGIYKITTGALIKNLYIFIYINKSKTNFVAVAEIHNFYIRLASAHQWHLSRINMHIHATAR